MPVTGRATAGPTTRAQPKACASTATVGRLGLAVVRRTAVRHDDAMQPVVAGDNRVRARVRTFSRSTAAPAAPRSLATEAPVISALTLDATPDGVATLFFADEMATVYAVNAQRPGALEAAREVVPDLDR